MNRFGTALLVCGLMLPVGTTQAIGYYGEGPYIGFSVGATNYDIGVGNWDERPEGSLDRSASSVDDQGFGVKFFWGYMLSDYFGLEVFYTNLGETEFEGVSDGSQGFWADGPVSGYTKNSGYGFSTMANIPIGELVDIFAKAGMYRWSVRERVSGQQPEFSGRFSDSGSDMMFGGGLGVNLSSQSSVRLEWERYNKVFDIYDVDMISLGFMHRF